MRTKIAASYSAEWLEVERPQPLSDDGLESAIQDVLSGKVDKDISDSVYADFKYKMQYWLFNSKLNKLQGLENFNRIDIINGCTQFIDSIYMSGPVQTLRNDYRYHERLGISYIKDVGGLIPSIPLVIAMPFPSIAAPHSDMEEILDEARNKNIDVHVDGAWITCCRGVVFDFSHPAIKSVGISLSKGLGLGWNRIGLRWTKFGKVDSISLMNDFHMNIRAATMIGNYFLDKFQSDYLWNKHGDNYYKVCDDFGLEPTNAIHIALRDGSPVGVSPLLRYLERAG